MRNNAHDKADDAIDALARRFGAALRRFFRRRILPQPDVEDLVQEVFLRLLRRGGVEDVEDLEAYVFVTASNVLRDRHRYRIASKADHHQPLDEDGHDNSAFSPERVLQARQALQCLVTALEELPKLTQAVFVLCVLEGQTHEEAAEDLGMSARNIRKHLSKAQKHLMARRDHW